LGKLGFVVKRGKIYVKPKFPRRRLNGKIDVEDYVFSGKMKHMRSWRK